MRILVIEDDRATADYVAKGLGEEGHVVDVARDGRDGLFLALNEPFDVVVTDRMMPGADGLSIVRALRASGVHTPVLVLTALAEVDRRVEGLEAGADDYLAKPFAFAELRARVRALARRPHAAGAESAELQVLYSRLIGYFFDAQIGIRQDVPIRPREGSPARTHLVVGIQGLLPNLFELNVQGFVNHRGTVAARVEASYDLYITQRLVAEPEIELEFAANSDRPARVGKGLTSFETGLRLRYEITREFAPYVGVSYERAVGETAGLYRRFGERPEVTSAVAGIRLFF